MTPDISFMSAFEWVVIIGIIVSLIVPVAVIVLIVWAIRRYASARRDPAEEALRDRLARGEIDMAEFQVRLRALRDGNDT
jgi:uncharacterized membrane protein